MSGVCASLVFLKILLKKPPGLRSTEAKHITDTPLFMQPERVFALHQLWYLSGVDATEWAESWCPAASCCLFLTEPPFETSELSVGESCSAENIELLTQHQRADVSTNVSLLYIESTGNTSLMEAPASEPGDKLSMDEKVSFLKRRQKRKID